MPRVALISLGCAKNLVDSEDLVTVLRGMGFSLTPELAAADLVLINTCGFVADAKRESIDHILAAAEGRRPGAKLLVAGCLTTRYREELPAELPEVDAWLPLADYPRLQGIVARLFPGLRRPGAPPARRSLLTPPHYAYLKVADGCDNACHFCAIPAIRGPHVSRPLPDVVAAARDLAGRGVREIVLVAQQLDHYGVDLYGEARLAELVPAVADAAPAAWIRLHYCYPDGLDDRLLDALAGRGNVLPYLDLPVQHASDRVLRRMGRGTDRRTLTERIAAARRVLPDAVLRTTFLVGHPGERVEDLEELLEFIAEQRFDLAGCFAYSAEEGTVSAAMRDQVPPAEIAERRRRVVEAQAAVHAERLRRWTGRELTVLVDGPGEDGRRSCRHYGQAPEVDNVTLVAGDDPPVGDFVRARVTGTDGYDLLAEFLPGPAGAVDAR